MTVKNGFIVCTAYDILYNSQWECDFSLLYAFCYHVTDREPYDIWTQRVYDLKGQRYSAYDYAFSKLIPMQIKTSNILNNLGSDTIVVSAIKSSETTAKTTDFTYKLGKELSDLYDFDWRPEILKKTVNGEMHRNTAMHRSDRYVMMKNYTCNNLDRIPSSFIIVDDVCTSGATMYGISCALKKAVKVNVPVYGIVIGKHEGAKYWKGSIDLSNSHIRQEAELQWQSLISEYRQ